MQTHVRQINPHRHMWCLRSMPKILKIYNVHKVLLRWYKINKPESNLDDTYSSYSKYCIDVSGEAIFITDNSSEG